MALNLEETLLENFTEYAEYVNNERAIAYYYDGLKPVMRRALYTMYSMKLKPEGQTKKCATIVGKIMEYHPHGDSGIYNAVVRSAQDFSLLLPIIEGMGNFGSLDMPPAAARYTEAKISPLGWALVEGLSDKIVPMIPNYDGTTEEPVFLPVPFPYLLVNGTSGIGVGMAASIPSHNLDDVINTTTHLLLNPNSSIEEIVSRLNGPDFGSGCEIVNKADFVSAYETGRGGFKMRAKFSVAGNQIKATNLPYHVSGAKILEQLNLAQANGDLSFVKEVIDMSGEEEVVLINISTKDTDMAIRELCRASDLEKVFSLDFSVVLDTPRRIGLIEYLNSWILMHKELNRKRLNQDRDLAESRLHILDGLLKATKMMDEVIKTIRASEDRAAAKTALVGLGFSILQSEAILDMKLARLTKLNELSLIKEADDLKEKIKYFTLLLESENDFNQYLAKNMVSYKPLSKVRKSLISQNVFAKIVKEVDTRFSVNFIKNKNKVLISEGYSSKEINGDSSSPVYVLSGNSVVPIKNAKEPVVAEVFSIVEPSTEYSLHISEDGYIKKTNLADLKVSRKAIITKQDKVVAALIGSKNEKRYVLLTLNDGKKIQFTVSDIKATGRNARGVIAVKLEEGQKVVNAEWTEKLSNVSIGRNKFAK